MAVVVIKFCTKCETDKSIDDFHKNKSKVDGRNPWCKKCVKDYGSNHYQSNRERRRAQNKRWADENPDKMRGYFEKSHNKYKHTRRAYWLRKRHKITVADYDRMFSEQGGVCAICGLPEQEGAYGKPRPLAVDHDHATGVIRTLLCHRCNKGIGCFRDTPIFLENAARYLRQHGKV